MPASDKVFVYGTLRRGFSLHGYLDKETIRFLGRGKISGKLYDLGDYPGAVPSEASGSEVEGELYELTDPDTQLNKLDEVEEFDRDRPEESLFVRQLADVELESGEKVKAWVYFLLKKPAKARLIPSGVYSEVRRTRH